MHLLAALLLLQVAGQPASSAMLNEIEEIRAAIPGDAACANPPEDDMRPYTLCLSETWFNEAEAQLEQQLKVMLAHLEATKGASAANRLRRDQRKWTKRRDKECKEEMADSPMIQVARDTLGCQTEWTERRTAKLKLLATSD